MEHLYKNVHSSRARMMTCYERFRLGHYAGAFRDLAFHILRDNKKEKEEAQGWPGASAIYGHWHQRTMQRFGENMRDTAELIEGLGRQQCSFEAPGGAARRRLEQRLKKEGFELYDILVIQREGGYREYLLSLKTREGRLLEVERAGDILTSVFALPIRPTLQCPIFVSAEFHEFLFETAGEYQVETGKAMCSKAGEEFSGDTYSFFTREGSFYCMLADGPGSGEQARQASGRLLDLAENYIESGFQEQQLLRFLEEICMAAWMEHSVPSFDYSQFDLHSGRLRLAKYGSAPTLLWTEKKWKCIHAANLLLGLSEEETNWSEECLQGGDYVIFLSDGVAEVLDLEILQRQLTDCFAENMWKGAAELAQEILALAVAQAQGSPRDDMTVLVLRIHKN